MTSQGTIISKAKSDRSSYLSHLLSQVRSAASSEAGWQEIRDRAAAIVQELAIPSTRDEEWRFTDLSSLLQTNFQPATAVELPSSELSLPEAAQSRLTFVNGVYAPALSAVTHLPEGVFVGNLAQLPESYRRNLFNYLAKQPGSQEVFTALNIAGITDVAVVWIPKNRQVEAPIHLVFVAAVSDAPVIVQPRCLVVAESGSGVTLVEEFINHRGTEGTEKEEKVYFTNAVTEIWVGENAQVNHNRIQWESGAAFHIGKSAISQARNSRYTCTAISLGGQLSRHNLEVFQAGEGTETYLNGLTAITDEQLSDTHSAIALNYPHGTTDQLHKCIVGDRAHAVFNGKVFVPKPAQLTNAGQLNRNLLLSPKARVDTKPQLEITADNVKCSHGATVSQLEDDEIFYLQSRCIDADSARHLLINAFANEIIERIPLTSLREKLTATINQQNS